MKTLELTGQVFGRLTAISRGDKQGSRFMWICRCSCGQQKSIRSDHLLSGKTVSCGCYFKDVMVRLNRTHGKTDTRVYRIWRNMINRCTNPNVGQNDWNRYGGRGITVCDRWRSSFESFLEDMGEPPEGMSIDRFPDVNGNYEPKNCRWATNKEQQNNRRSNRLIEFDGRTMTLAQWADETGINCGTILSRLDKFGWSVERSLTTAPAYNHPKQD